MVYKRKTYKYFFKSFITKLIKKSITYKSSDYIKRKNMDKIERVDVPKTLNLIMLIADIFG